MKTETIRDAQFRILGFIQTLPNGEQLSRDRHYRVKGRFNPKENITRDTSFRRVAFGQALSSTLDEQ
jgi:hypothetical protein